VISVITPTSDRPAAWPLAERWMARQTVQPAQWIVADDGAHAAPLTAGQLHLRRPFAGRGAHSLAANLLAAIPHVRGDVVLIAEDDDYYRPDHIATQLRHLERFDATGGTWLDYYNLRHRRWRTLRNRCAALCNTAFRAAYLPVLAQACEAVLARADGYYGVDALFWDAMGTEGLHEDRTVVGLKGLPGSAGIGMGHRPGRGWQRDPAWRQLRAWLGEDAQAYIALMHAHAADAAA
jgi:hypothetical protein